jgi:uncharacterized protein YjbI with pentapeptide repeats
MDKSKWVWMDRNCHIHDRVELDRILANHKLWLKKYAVQMAKGKPPEGLALHDPLRADLAGAQLSHVQLDGVSLMDANLTGADLIGAHISSVDFTYAALDSADLTGATVKGSDFTQASLQSTNLTGADLSCADPEDEGSKCAFLGGADLDSANLTSANFSGADLTGASLTRADLTCGVDGHGEQSCAALRSTDLSKVNLESAKLIGTDLGNARLGSANLDHTDLTGANLRGVDLSNASVVQADLSSAILQDTDLSGADLTLAKLWYADFEPKAPPLHGTIAAGEGLETVRWFEPAGFMDELAYRSNVELAAKSQGNLPPPRVPPMQDRWLVWLSCYRERAAHEERGWIAQVTGSAADAFYLVSDVLLGRRPRGPECASMEGVETGQRYQDLNRDPIKAASDPGQAAESTLAEYQLVDIRTAAQSAGHPEVALEVNLAIQRHTQSQLKMVAFDWTCGYGAAPARPIFLAVLLAAIAMPFYWFGFRRQRLGVRLFRVDSDTQKEEDIPLGGWESRPAWRTLPKVAAVPQSTWRRELMTRFYVLQPIDRSRQSILARWPRVRWEISFFKAVALFSMISVIDLGFDGFDFGRWVRLLFFSEYDLKARGWMRFVAGVQSLIGLGLLSLALLSFFGHPFF